MQVQYEFEIRIFIENIGEFIQKLKNFNATKIKEYKFTDNIYIPKNPISNWNPNKKTMRIREYISSEEYAQILFTENEIIEGKNFQFKQSKYPGGKVELFRGDRKEAQALLLAWDFVPFFQIKKEEGQLYEIKKPKRFIIALEKIHNFGYSAEIEVWGNTIENVEITFLKFLSLLKIPLQSVSSNTLPYIIAEHHKLLNKIS